MHHIHLPVHSNEKISASINPISTGGGGGVFSTPPICFLPVTFLLLSQFPPNLVTFLKFNAESGER